MKCPHGGASIERCSCCSCVWDDYNESLRCRMFPDVCCKCGGELVKEDIDLYYYRIKCTNVECLDVKQPEYRLREDRAKGPGPDWLPLWKVREEMIGK